MKKYIIKLYIYLYNIIIMNNIIYYEKLKNKLNYLLNTKYNFISNYIKEEIEYIIIIYFFRKIKNKEIKKINNLIYFLDKKINNIYISILRRWDINILNEEENNIFSYENNFINKYSYEIILNVLNKFNTFKEKKEFIRYLKNNKYLINYIKKIYLN